MIKSKTKRKTKSANFNKSSYVDFSEWESWSGQKYHSMLLKARFYYYENLKLSELVPEIWTWMKENGYSNQDVACAKIAHTASGALGYSIAIFCKLLNQGVPDYNPAYEEYWVSLPGTSNHLKPISESIKPYIEKAITQGQKIQKSSDIKKPAKSKSPNVQEILNDQAIKIAEDIDAWLDEFVENKFEFDPESFDIKKYFLKKEINQAHARKIQKFYIGELEEFKSLLSIPSPSKLSKLEDSEQDYWHQLKEGYKFYRKTDIKKYISALENVIGSCEFLIETNKSTKTIRKSKPKPASKLVEKLKYKKICDKYALTSVSPESVVGANVLWVFDTKTRKLGKYVASNPDPKNQGRPGSGLSVKGTTITGFDTEQSIQKTLRQPEQALKEFKSSGKVALRKFLDNISTVDTKLTGRCNENIILLKVH